MNPYEKYMNFFFFFFLHKVSWYISWRQTVPPTLSFNYAINKVFELEFLENDRRYSKKKKKVSAPILFLTWDVSLAENRARVSQVGCLDLQKLGSVLSPMFLSPWHACQTRYQPLVSSLFCHWSWQTTNKSSIVKQALIGLRYGPLSWVNEHLWLTVPASP